MNIFLCNSYESKNEDIYIIYPKSPKDKAKIYYYNHEKCKNLNIEKAPPLTQENPKKNNYFKNNESNDELQIIEYPYKSHSSSNNINIYSNNSKSNNSKYIDCLYKSKIMKYKNTKKRHTSLCLSNTNFNNTDKNENNSENSFMDIEDTIKGEDNINIEKYKQRKLKNKEKINFFGFESEINKNSKIIQIEKSPIKENILLNINKTMTQNKLRNNNIKIISYPKNKKLNNIILKNSNENPANKYGKIDNKPNSFNRYTSHSPNLKNNRAHNNSKYSSSNINYKNKNEIKYEKVINKNNSNNNIKNKYKMKEIYNKKNIDDKYNMNYNKRKIKKKIAFSTKNKNHINIIKNDFFQKE